MLIKDFVIDKEVIYKGCLGSNNTAFVVGFTKCFVKLSKHKGSLTETILRKPSNLKKVKNNE